MTLPQPPSAPQPQSQHFLLKWNNHRSNMVSVFESLLQSENLVDVTLAVEGKFLKGHKIVLSACSPYFESMFVNQTPGEKHPILIFHDMKFSHLKTLLDFMYRGEISIDEKDLSDVLKVAEALSIRGLSSFESDDEDTTDKSSEANGNDSSMAANSSSPMSGSAAALSAGAVGYGYNSNGASISSNAESNNNNNNINNQTQSQSDNHCISGNMNCDSSVNGSMSSSSNSSNSNSNSNNNTSSSNNNNNNSNTHNSSSSTSKHHGKGSASVRSQKKGNNYASPSPQPPSPPLPPAPASSSVTTGVKRRRGRQPARKDSAPSPSRASTFKQAQSDRKFQGSCPPVKSLSSRQRVRRRMPRQFSMPSSINPARIKVEKHSDTEETGSGVVSGATTPDDDEMDTSDFMVPDMDGASGILPADMCNSEPLSEMSVRGLDLFKYASIENGVYRCIECEKLCIPKTFKNKYSFQRHAFLYHEGNMRKVFPCPVCSREFSRPDKMKNHLRSIHEGGKNGRHNNNGSNEPPGNSGDNSNDFNDKCDV